MRRFCVLALLICSAVACFAEAPLWLRARKYALDNGATYGTASRFTCKADKLTDWDVPGVKEPTASQLAAVIEPDVAVLPVEQTIKDNDRVRAKTAPEVAAEKLAGHAARPIATRKLENRYIRICDDVLAIAGDARAGAHAALTVAELYAVMESADTKNADTKNADKALAKATRQLVITLTQLNQADPSWQAALAYDATAGE